MPEQVFFGTDSILIMHLHHLVMGLEMRTQFQFLTLFDFSQSLIKNYKILFLRMNITFLIVNFHN